MSARAGISAAYEWDNAADDATLAAGVSGSINDKVPGDPDAGNATWEFWVKPANTTDIMTLFETGGATGFGCIINQGVLEAATGLDGSSMTGSYVSYDLLADPQGLVGGNPTTEFNQYAVTITINGGLQLYVNGVKVDETIGGVPGDWDGGDGAGLGGFGETNHGGFLNTAAGSAYDAPFLGQMAIVRLYSGVLSGAEILQNFKSVNAGTDIDGDAISVTGVVDGSGIFVPIGSPATLASGSIVTMNNNSGEFDYKPNGAFNLAPNEIVMETFTYQASDGNGEFAQANVNLLITGVVSGNDDNLLASEGENKAFFANAIVGNDEELPTAAAPYINLIPANISGGTWMNTGSAGSGWNGSSLSSVSAPTLESNFGRFGATAIAGNIPSLDPISAADATFEVWFKPTPGQSAKSTIFETGGNGIGFSIVYDPAAGSVIATIDGVELRGRRACHFLGELSQRHSRFHGHPECRPLGLGRLLRAFNPLGHQRLRRLHLHRCRRSRRHQHRHRPRHDRIDQYDPGKLETPLLWRRRQQRSRRRWSNCRQWSHQPSEFRARS